ncbi:MAG: hypothetical protein ABIP30_09615 [Ferruginibacter sp.]
MFYERPILLLVALLCTFCTYSQDIKFSPVSTRDFNFSKINIDTTEGAIVISEIGSGTIEGTKYQTYSFFYRVHKRILILSKNALDLAKVEFYLYKNENEQEEKVEKLNAVTYNLVDGKIEETVLGKDDVFKTKIDKRHTIEKFTMPNVKEGSIIDYSFTLKSDFLSHIRPWYFQSRYPKLWSEYSLDYP